MAKRQIPKRMHAVGERWHWRPDPGLRPHFQNVALGANFTLAVRKADELNRKVEAWRKARDARGAAEPGRPARRKDASLTVGDLCLQYREAGVAAQRWAAATFESLDYELSVLQDRFGSTPALALKRSDVVAWIEQMQARAPETARKIGGRGRAVFGWAIDKAELIERANPFLKLGLGGGRKRKTRVNRAQMLHIVMIADQMSAEPYHEGRRALAGAFLAGFECVQRITDMLRLDETHIRWVTPVDDYGRAAGPPEQRLIMAQSKKMKRRKGRTVPGDGGVTDMLLPDLVAERLRLYPARPCAPDAQGRPRPKLCFGSRHARPYDERHAAHAWREIVDVARVTMPTIPAGLQLRDCRRSGFVQKHLDGATVPDICSMSLHTIEEGYAIIEHYLPKTAEQADRAVRASKGRR